MVSMHLAHNDSSSDRPVVIVPPTPFMRLFATCLQALYAAKPFRNALMLLNLSDLRLTLHGRKPSMDDYWQGNSPAGSKGLSEVDWSALTIKATEEEREALDGTMRLLTLFVFLTYTKRPLCLAEDLISRPIKTNYAYVMNSSRRPASDIVSCMCFGRLMQSATVSLKPPILSSHRPRSSYTRCIHHSPRLSEYSRTRQPGCMQRCIEEVSRHL
jgi:hypothetical protein